MKVRREIIILACLSVLSIVFVLSCEDNDHIIGEKGFTVSGKVTDSVRAFPIDSARVTWKDTLVFESDAYTDSTGNYSLLVPQGHRIIYVQKAGYKTKGRELGTFISDVSNFNFELVSE